MQLLSLETSTESCTAALLLGDRLRERYEYAPRRHAELILPMIDDLLREADMSLRDLDAIAVGRGPGAFTGVRIAMGVAQGLALGAELPVVPVSSLAVLAQGAVADHSLILAAFDARMGEVYWGAYRVEDGLVTLVGEEQVAKPGDVVLPDSDGWFGVGTGWGTHGAELQARLGDRLLGFEGDRFPRAGDLARLAARDFAAGRAVDVAEAQPVYLRDRVTG